MCAEVSRARPTCSSDPVARVRSPPILHGVDRIRVVIAEDNYLVREGVRRLLEAQAELEVVARLRGLRRTARRGRRAERPTSSSPTSACRRRAPTRASAPPNTCATAIPTSAWSCSASTPSPRYALALLERGSAGRAYLLKERVSDVDQLLARHPRGRPRRLGDRPEGRRGARRRAGPGQGVTARRGSRPARARSWPRWPRARTTPRSPPRSGCRERAVEKHINSLFSKLGLIRGDRRAPPGEGGAAVPVRPGGLTTLRPRVVGTIARGQCLRGTNGRGGRQPPSPC